MNKLQRPNIIYKMLQMKLKIKNNISIKKKIKQMNQEKKKQQMINKTLREGINKIINKSKNVN